MASSKILTTFATFFTSSFIIMINRRVLRIKALQVLYSHFKNGDQTMQNAENQLLFSIKKSYDLYHYLFWFIKEVADFAEDRIELNKKKNFPTENDLHPNRKFVDNKLIKLINDNIQLNDYISVNKISWINNPELVKLFYHKMIESELYAAYIQGDSSTFEEDKKFVAKLYSSLLLEFDELYHLLEEQSIYWNDEIDFVINMVAKTIKTFTLSKGADASLMPQFKDEDDVHFVKTLVRKSILHHAEYQKLIQESTSNWEIERIAYIDNIIMLLAITEMVEFSQIPLKVTFNEYIDLAKLYSTQKSSIFINGIIDKIGKQLIDEGKVKKTGRGLID